MTQIHPSAVVAPEAKLASDCRIDAFSVIGPDVVVGSGTIIGSHVVIEGITEIGKRCQIFSHVVLGTAPQIFQDRGERTKLVIGDETVIREFASVHRGSVKGRGVTALGCRNYIMAYAHIAHDCIVHDDVVVASQAGLAGHVEVEARAVIGGQTGIHQFVRIGQCAMVGACSAVLQDIPPFLKAQGNRAKCYGLNTVGLRRHGMSEEAILRLKQAYRLLFLSHLNTSQALDRIASEVTSCPEIDHLMYFIKLSARGIAR
ncbi:acyl-[acyl-carrier-protein]--UDP-N-acetylglucosamine O-acyltransferase (UDP-N-acetylglucosamine acyltransferase) [Candidatus Methylomirabilis lanthanidiphila]|uniref:Acyl-[acyl-carrier-protein]--UDP-N-acetylglucosamine O-acyltransferase n=1 Tax=Candidatus Methylomirabilis lanthanidiphila TaxID=2211376 RepID=A0A564ZM83_9BACT|nr:acyl-ACP--UDP-N-acetylglucosamine O-acyltransferase [Candidatus Methylomirabilis lanthanidiphila]VUZ85967.1 acyl-[acyl-carrier-protein]--UDP-N-acetylglucosamine O-acyltransferase (UDP-N-acetylglucosamine acyltransferase) [Candidatus Methylomirabilis lanthanidiphila]